MAIKPIPRDASGAIITKRPGRRYRRWSVDFAEATTIPTWLTATGGASIGINTTDGHLRISSGTDTNNYARVVGPSFDLSKMEAIFLHVDGQHLENSEANGWVFQGICETAALPASVGTGNGKGAALMKLGFNARTFLRNLASDWPVLSGGTPTALGNQLTVDTVFEKSAARVSRSIAIYPYLGMAYALEDRTEVMHARELTDITTGTVAPTLYSRADSGNAQAYRVQGIEIEAVYRA